MTAKPLGPKLLTSKVQACRRAALAQHGEVGESGCEKSSSSESKSRVLRAACYSCLLLSFLCWDAASACWCLAKSQRANSRNRGCGHVEMLMMLLSDLAQERICDMVQDCRAQMTRPKNIHENPVQAPSKLKADILVKLRRVDIKNGCLDRAFVDVFRPCHLHTTVLDHVTFLDPNQRGAS